MQFSTKAARIIFTATTLVLLALAFILYVQVKDLIVSYNQINGTTVIKLKMEQALSNIRDAETAQRGFLLTNDSVFLQPYTGAYEKTKSLLSEIRELTADNADQQQSLNALFTLTELRFRTFNTVIEQYNLPGISGETKKSHLLKGQSSLDSIFFHAQKIVTIEDDLLKQREDIKNRHSFLAPFYAFLLIVTALAILIFSYDKIIQQLNRSKKLLSRLRELNSTLRQKNHELELYNKELDSFTYIASHDLKEPLRKIMTFSAMIEESEYPDFSDRNKLHFQRIQHAARRMQNLLDDLLMYSHTSKTSIDFQKVDLNTILEEVEENLAEEIKDHEVEIKSEKLPVVKGLPFQLKQLFENLITNSIKYKQDHLKPAIEIESTLLDRKDIKTRFFKKSNKYYRIIFKDNGSGFEQSYADKVFQLFQRIHNGNQKGTGIGLTICKKIVQNHNGFIRAVSEVNKGTRFEIYLPYT